MANKQIAVNVYANSEFYTDRVAEVEASPNGAITVTVKGCGPAILLEFNTVMAYRFSKALGEAIKRQLDECRHAIGRPEEGGE
ncbi:hypothetical protein [Thioalkalivibrio sp. ALE12]|uniref:hypothetical protein n=1 Tax=Thioalkalivibrio sp. ALE12 TaxID=1158170 RepID=UPI00037408BE|nr:hypothetical protein [Thioalkalivibrio sp. ALE12]